VAVSESESENLQALIIVSCDGLGARFLGPYGNTWLETPAIDRLAAEGLLFENTVATRAQRAGCMHTILQRVSGPTAGCDFRSWLQHPASFVVSSEPPELLGSAWPGGIQPRWLTVPCEAACGKAGDWSATFHARLFATFLTQLEQTVFDEAFDTAAESNSQAGPQLAWLHSSALLDCWDAPPELADQFTAEEDPPPYRLVQPPCEICNAYVDPDDLLAYTHAYAAEVQVWDQCVAMLLATLEEHRLLDRVMIILTSSCGYPLGEHRVVGPHVGKRDPAPTPLYGESIQVPLIISPTRLELQGRRLLQPAQLNQVPRFASACCQEDLAAFEDAVQQARQLPFAVCTNHSGEAAIQSPAWLLIDRQPQPELFVKPDDRWEVNDVAQRCPEIASELARLLHHLQRNTDDTPIEFDRRVVETID